MIDYENFTNLHHYIVQESQQSISCKYDEI